MNFEIEDEQQKKKKEYKKKNNLLVYLSLFFLVLAIILVIAYLLISTKSKQKNITPSPTVIEEPKQISIIDETSNERPLAVMIDNNIGDAKHAGLQDSYVNYEAIVEGGLTRIMAIYKDKEVSVIGPVRSARHYFLDYALEHDAVYAHFGWSPYAEENIASLNVQNINGMIDTAPYMRDNNLPSPHNVFTSTMKLRNYFEKKSYSSTSLSWKVFTYSVDEIDLNEAKEISENSNILQANKVSMDYSYYENRSYTYDSINHYYLRTMNGMAHIDRQSNNQLHYKNIIIIKVENKTIDDEGRQDLETTGSGTGYYITNGYSIPINWSKQSRTAKTQFTYTNGTELKINDGNTFVQIIPISSNIVIE